MCFRIFYDLNSFLIFLFRNSFIHTILLPFTLRFHPGTHSNLQFSRQDLHIHLLFLWQFPERTPIWSARNIICHIISNTWSIAIQRSLSIPWWLCIVCKIAHISRFRHNHNQYCFRHFPPPKFQTYAIHASCGSASAYLSKSSHSLLYSA